MKEYRVRVIIEERRVSKPSQDNYLSQTKRSRWVKTGIDTTSIFSEDYDAQSDLYDKLREIVHTDNMEKTAETRAAIKALLSKGAGA